MFSEIQQIKIDGSIDGIIKKDDIAIHYHIEGDIIKAVKSSNIDVLAEVRAAIFDDFKRSTP